MSINEIEFGKVLGAIESLNKRFDDATMTTLINQKLLRKEAAELKNLFTTHAKLDEDRFEKVLEKLDDVRGVVAENRGNIRVWMTLISAGVSALVAGSVGYFFKG